MRQSQIEIRAVAGGIGAEIGNVVLGNLGAGCRGLSA